jgi:RNA polymerase sigma-70 factor (ECF subfamily)
MQDQDDAALAARAASGDTAAFEVLVARYQRVLFSVAHRMLGDRDDAADATQTAFFKAYKRLGSFDPRFRFYSWIYRILLNECLNVRRDAKVHEAISPDLPGNGSPDAGIEAGERRRLVQRALMKLPQDDRQVIVLRHFGELSYDDIAEILHIPAKTVKSRLYTARQRLMQLLIGENTQ